MNLLPPSISLEHQQLTPAKMAWVMDVGHSTVEDWTKYREVDHFKKGRIIRISPEAATAFIFAHTVRAKGVTGYRSAGVSGMPELPAQQFELLWQRIERLIKTQITARLEQEPTERTERAA